MNEIIVLVILLFWSSGRVFYGCFFFFQAEDGIRDLVRSRGLGDVYKRQVRTGNSLTIYLINSGQRFEELSLRLILSG